MHGQMIEDNTRPDLKEGYYVSRDLPLDHPQVKAEKFAHGPNVWPESLGAPFRETCMDYLNRIVKLTEEVMGAMAMSLGYDKNYFDEFCTDPMCFYKLLHYPPQPTDAHALQRGTFVISTSLGEGYPRFPLVHCPRFPPSLCSSRGVPLFFLR